MAELIEIEITIWQDGERLDSELFQSADMADTARRAKYWLGNAVSNSKPHASGREDQS